MKIIVNLMSTNLSHYHQADGIIVNSQEYSCYNGFTTSKQLVIALGNEIRAQGKFAILNIDRIIEEHDLEALEQYLEEVILFFDAFIYSDMAIYHYFKERNALDKLIFDGKTIIASSYDLAFYREQQITCFLTNELSLPEIKEIASKENFAFTIYGYHQIFYSKRELLNLYQEFRGKQESLGNELLLLKEELREDYYRIYQGKQGTFIYTPTIYVMFEELLEIKDSLSYIQIDGIFLEEEKILQVLDLYRQLLQGNPVTREDLKFINPNISKGFLTNKSILLKDRPLPRQKVGGKK